MPDTLFDTLCETPPDEFCCPLSYDLMTDPVIVFPGQTFDRTSIQRWFEQCDLEGKPRTNPLTRHNVSRSPLIPNLALKALIEKWVHTQSIGISEVATQTEGALNPDNPVSQPSSSNRYTLFQSELDQPLSRDVISEMQLFLQNNSLLSLNESLRVYQVRALATCLKYDKHCYSLEIKTDGMHPAVLTLLFNALSENRSIYHLRIVSSEPFPQAQLLADKLEHNHAITNLQVTCQHVDVLQRLNAILLRNQTLAVNFLQAACMSDVTRVNDCLKQGVSVYVNSFDGNTPLHHAVFNQDLETARLLLEHMPNIQFKNAQSLTPLELDQQLGGRVSGLVASKAMYH